MTQKGKNSYQSTFGGIVSLIMVTILLGYGGYRVYQLYENPEYYSMPSTYDFKSDRTIELDLRKNMVSYKLMSEDDNPLESLRIVFWSDFDTVIPAIYCSDYYATEIAAEKSGESTSTFYKDNYDDSAEEGSSKLICPALKEPIVIQDSSYAQF